MNGRSKRDGLSGKTSARELVAPLALQELARRRLADFAGSLQPVANMITIDEKCENDIKCRISVSSAFCRNQALTPTPRAIEVLRRILRDRTPKAADPRAFAAVVAAELHARELVPELVALTQCPHPLVAAVARQAARKLGAACAQTGTLDEVAPFLFEADRARLDAWV